MHLDQQPEQLQCTTFISFASPFNYIHSCYCCRHAVRGVTKLSYIAVQPAQGRLTTKFISLVRVQNTHDIIIPFCLSLSLKCVTICRVGGGCRNESRKTSQDRLWHISQSLSLVRLLRFGARWWKLSDHSAVDGLDLCCAHTRAAARTNPRLPWSQDPHQNHLKKKASKHTARWIRDDHQERILASHQKRAFNVYPLNVISRPYIQH